MTNAAATLLLFAMLAIMAAKSIPIVQAPLAGKPLLDIRVPLLFRALGQRVNVLCILAVLVLGSGAIGERWIDRQLFLFVLVAVVGMLMIPSRYRITTAGLSPSRSVFRPWSDFERWEASGNVVYLRGRSRFGSVRLFVSGRDREELIRVLSRHLRNQKRDTPGSSDRVGPDKGGNR
ncbi:MAG TPA: hypothetical protein VFC51_02985 [Chloroflexota bacterium]|nr:hypothetical protein [Chloroflexota bacterium]